MLAAADVETAMGYVKQQPVDVVIADAELDGVTGIEFLQNLVKEKPLINTAVVSTLSAEDFHEATEGLGVLMQLPVRPLRHHAEDLLARLEKIAGLLATGKVKGGVR